MEEMGQVEGPIPTLNNKPRVAIIMHSHGSRMIIEMEKAPNRKPFKGYKHLNIAECEVRFFTGRGWTYHRINNERAGWISIKNWKPHLAYIEVATNDLDKDDHYSHVCTQANNFINKLLNNGCKRVILAECLKRTEKSHLEVDAFNEKMLCYNRDMREQLVYSDVAPKSVEKYKDPRRWWWEHQHIWKGTKPTLLPDGVHLTPNHGMKLQYFSIRLAVMKGLETLPN